MHTLLCLGDSSTIGEGLPLYLGYPYQTVQLLRAAGHDFGAPETIARTGWTTDELTLTLSTIRLLPRYDIVTLLIGVNNQYRGRRTDDYSIQFGQLLQVATRLAGSPAKVFVLSIPDWGCSPFADGRDKTLIAGEIDAFNAIASAACARQKTPFLDITVHSRTEGASAESFTADGLHPSAPTYLHWARQLADAISATLPAPIYPED